MVQCQKKFHLILIGYLNSAKGVFDSFKGLADIPENLNDYDFSVDLGSIVDASLNNCNLGFHSLVDSTKRCFLGR